MFARFTLVLVVVLVSFEGRTLITPPVATMGRLLACFLCVSLARASQVDQDEQVILASKACNQDIQISKINPGMLGCTIHV